MSASKGITRRKKEAVGRPASHRSGVLQRSEQLEESKAIVGPNQVRPELLLAFVKHLIKSSHGGDSLMLALYAAVDETKATEQEQKVMLMAIKGEWSKNKWPAGFMPDF